MVLPIDIIDLLKKKSGLQLYTPAECNTLREAVFAETGFLLGLNTIKRLLGFIPSNVKPHQNTLFIVARYLGYTDWGNLLAALCKSESDFDASSLHIGAASIAEGAVVHIVYHPQRELDLRHLAECQFEVIGCEGGKLRVGDRLTIYEFVLHFPLMVKDVVREGKSLGGYVAARRNGVQDVKIQ